MVKLQETFVVVVVEYRKLYYFTDHRVLAYITHTTVADELTCS